MPVIERRHLRFNLQIGLLAAQCSILGEIDQALIYTMV